MIKKNNTNNFYIKANANANDNNNNNNNNNNDENDDVIYCCSHKVLHLFVFHAKLETYYQNFP